MSGRRYYIQDKRTYVGDVILWWGPDRKGYTTKLAEAGLYDEEEAGRIFRLRGTDIPVLEEDARQAMCQVVMANDLWKVQEAAKRLPFGVSDVERFKT